MPPRSFSGGGGTEALRTAQAAQAAAEQAVAQVTTAASAVSTQVSASQLDRQNLWRKTAELADALAALRQQLATVEMTPGMTGDVGPAGPRGEAGPAGPKGDVGAQGPAPTTTQINAAVAAYLSANPPSVAKIRSASAALPPLAVGGTDVALTWAPSPMPSATYVVVATVAGTSVTAGRVSAIVKAGSQTATGCTVTVSTIVSVTAGAAQVQALAFAP